MKIYVISRAVFEFFWLQLKALLNKKQDKGIYLENVVVPITNWGTESSAYTINETYKYYYDIIIADCVETMVPEIIPDQATAEMSILSVNCLSMNGKVRIYVSSIPTSVLNFKTIKLERTE